ncbi:hypothetical protein DEJ48_13920 [Streptomyces venezuelae]|uniref:Uncharacterized protein n=1 Tax=Streptomyces venezuelae TaxID=54571 RepID=A0A5P2BWJ9_STRVZ|nr:hypothetical protein [Streptomyces venezuelae]QES34350.1 hypothetical protein DEJ48_13920 [Streptomyces venezuelae]
MKLVGDVRDSKGRAGGAVEITQKSWVRLGEAETPDEGKDITLRTKDRYVITPDTGLLLETTHRAIGKNTNTPADRYTWLEVGPADRVE